MFRLHEYSGLYGTPETFIHQEGSSLPLLIKAGLYMHSSIDPSFFDGNGGRELLITFMLCAEEVLRETVLYLSLSLKASTLYYDRLNETRKRRWTACLDFFLQVCGHRK